MNKQETLKKIEECYENSFALNNYEVSFLDSIKEQLVNSIGVNRLTNKQEVVLYNIHKKCMNFNNKTRR